MYATGLNDWGQLGMPSATGHSLVIFLKPSIGFYEHFSSNSNHICTASSVIQIHLFTNQISVLAFFYNFCFVLRSKASIVQELVEVEGLPNNTRFIHIAAGDYHSAAVSGSHFS